MKGTSHHRRMWFAGLLSAAVLVGSSLVAQAEPGKGRHSGERGHSGERRVERQVRSDRGDRAVRREWSQARQRPRGGAVDRQVRTNRQYRGDRQIRTNRQDRGDRQVRTNRQYRDDRQVRTNRQYRDDRQVRTNRQYRTDRQIRTNRQRSYGGSRSGVWTQSRPRFQSSYVTLQGGYRARRVYSQPYFVYDQRLCYVRPVRYFILASVGHQFYYGCNFCDLRFGGYFAYQTHVHHCDHRPSGFELEVSDWSDDWSQAACDIEDCDVHGDGYAAGGHDENYDDGDGHYEDDQYDAY